MYSSQVWGCALLTHNKIIKHINLKLTEVRKISIQRYNEIKQENIQNTP